MIDDLRYGKPVQKLANAWHSRECYTTEQADAYKAEYLREREDAYVRMCAGYAVRGLPLPPPTILSGIECP